MLFTDKKKHQNTYILTVQVRPYLVHHLRKVATWKLIYHQFAINTYPIETNILLSLATSCTHHTAWVMLTALGWGKIWVWHFTYDSLPDAIGILGRSKYWDVAWELRYQFLNSTMKKKYQFAWGPLPTHPIMETFMNIQFWRVKKYKKTLSEKKQYLLYLTTPLAENNISRIYDWMNKHDGILKLVLWIKFLIDIHVLRFLRTQIKNHILIILSPISPWKLEYLIRT